MDGAKPRPRAGWHHGTTTWTIDGGELVQRPRAVRRAAGERSRRHRYRQRSTTTPPDDVYRVDRPGTLRRQARIPLWLIRSPAWRRLCPSDRARLLSHLSHADAEGEAIVPRDTTAREIGRLACTVTRADKRLRAAGWLAIKQRRVSRHQRRPNVVRLRLPGRLHEIDAEVRRRLAGDAPVPTEGLRDDDIYIASDGRRRVRCALVFAWELEQADVRAVLRAPIAGQVWLALRSLLVAGPRRLTRLEIAEAAGLVEQEAALYHDDPVVDAVRERRCREGRKRVTEAVVSLEVLGLIRPERERGAPSRYHLLVPAGCEAFVPHLGDLTPRAWGTVEPARSAVPAPGACASCGRPAGFDRVIPREGWFDFCFDAAHAGQRPPSCLTCHADADGEKVTFDPASGSLTCLHCDAHGRAAFVVAPPRRVGGRVHGEPAIEDGPPPDQRVVPDGAAERVARAYLDGLPAGVRDRRRSARPTADEVAAARVLVALGGVEHATWCARRLAAAPGAGMFLPSDAASRVTMMA